VIILLVTCATEILSLIMNVKCEVGEADMKYPDILCDLCTLLPSGVYTLYLCTHCICIPTDKVQDTL
jgi:hypothetical protein